MLACSRRRGPAPPNRREWWRLRCRFHSLRPRPPLARRAALLSTSPLSPAAASAAACRPPPSRHLLKLHVEEEGASLARVPAGWPTRTCT